MTGTEKDGKAMGGWGLDVEVGGSRIVAIPVVRGSRSILCSGREFTSSPAVGELTLYGRTMTTRPWIGTSIARVYVASEIWRMSSGDARRRSGTKNRE